MNHDSGREWTKTETLLKLIHLQKQYNAVVAQNKSLQKELFYIKKELKKILELNSDCANCAGDCTYCMNSTNKETYEIAKEMLR